MLFGWRYNAFKRGFLEGMMERVGKQLEMEVVCHAREVGKGYRLGVKKGVRVTVRVTV